MTLAVLNGTSWRTATGPWQADRWYVVADEPCTVEPALEDTIASFADERPDLSVIYGDAPGPVSRPDFDRTRLFAQDYIGGLVAVKGRVLLACGPEGPVFRLLHNALLCGAEIGKVNAVVGGGQPGGEILPTLRELLPRLYPGCEVLPGALPHTAERRRIFAPMPEVAVVHAGPPPDLSQTENTDAVNLLPLTRPLRGTWKRIRSPFVVLLAAGVQPVAPAWLRSLMTFAVEEEVGAVGWHADAAVQRECLWLPDGAVALRRSLLEEFCGSDPGYGDSAALINMCLHLRQLGLKIIAVPPAGHAPLPATIGGADLARLRLSWPILLTDPAFTG